MTLQAGQYITDGTAVFIVDDVRDGYRVGDIVYRPYLADGYVKANGATVDRADYPRLVALATEKELWTSTPSTEKWKYGTGDESTTMVLPDYRDRVLQGGDDAELVEAGLPNINGALAAKGAVAWQAANGAFYLTGATAASAGGAAASEKTQLQFDASLSNDIYGASDTVQPPAIVLIPQIKY